MNEFKRCPMCKRTLPLSEFPPNRSRRNGHYEYCRPCKRDYDRAYMTARRAKAQAASDFSAAEKVDA